MEAYAACSERKSARTVAQAHGGAHARGILQPKDGAHHVQATREIRGQAPRAQASQPGHRTWRDRGGPLSGKIRAVLAGPRRVKSPRPPSLVRRVVGGPPAALERGKHKSHAASELPFELRRSLVFVSAPRGWELLPRPGSLLGRAKRKRAQTEREPVAICHLERAASSPSLLEAGVVIVGDRSR